MIIKMCGRTGPIPPGTINTPNAGTKASTLTMLNPGIKAKIEKRIAIPPPISDKMHNTLSPEGKLFVSVVIIVKFLLVFIN